MPKADRSIEDALPEPDFEQLARQAISGSEFHIKRVAEQLRQVWNARGDADADLRKAAETVVERFTRDEEQGYHSRDRQYVIDVLGRALRDAPAGLRLPGCLIPEP